MDTATYEAKQQCLVAFLADLEMLYKKHDMFVSGCGCCGSPWIDTPNSAGPIDSIQDAIEHLGEQGI